MIAYFYGMKTVIGFFFVALFGLQTIQGTITLIDWKINQLEITNEYCINKARPELNCKGKCHISKILNNQLEENIQKKNQKNNSKLFKIKQLELAITHPIYNQIKPVVTPINEIQSEYTNHYHFQHTSFLFHPPSC